MPYDRRDRSDGLGRDFRMLWAANAVSLAGTAVTGIALPMIAIYDLHASPFEVGLLTTMTWLPQLALGLPAGVLVDRIRRRPLLVAADVGRALILAAVPLVAAFGVLHLWTLYVVAAATGVLTMLFGLGWTAYLPFLINRDRLVDGNSKLEATNTVIGIAGPGLGGLLVQLMSAALALVADAASYLLSAACLAAIRAKEPNPPRQSRIHLLRELGEGFRFLTQHPLAAAFVAFFAFGALVMTAHQTLLVLFLVRTVGLQPGVVGGLLAVGGAGGFLGALLAPRLSQRLGPARTLRLAVTTTFPFGLLIPLTQPGWGLTAYIVGAAALGAGLTVTNIIPFSFLLSICPTELLGRVASVARTLQYAGSVLGGILGGTLASWLGVRSTMWITMVALLPLAILIAASPLQHLRDLPSSRRTAA